MDDFTTALDRLNVEWITLVALRDAVGIALKDTGAANYEETLRLGELLVPFLFHRDRSLLKGRGESSEVRECRAIANALSISFEEAVSREIERYRALLQRTNNAADAQVLQNRLNKLMRIGQQAQEKKYYEGRVIQRDALVGIRLPVSRLGDGYYDFALPSDRAMRIRITHETSIEEINGADVIYEHHWVSRRLARIAAIQYKIMEQQGYVPKTRSLRKQIGKLSAHFCQGLPCILPQPACSDRLYRLPTCTAFLRATNRRQSNDARMISTGRFITVCTIKGLLEEEKAISLENVEGEVVTYRVFEELFNTGLLGSRWLNYDELEELYQGQDILEPHESVAIHMQVVHDLDLIRM